MIDARRHALTALVLLSLVVGAQLAFTDVGEEIGPHWSEPAVVTEFSGGGVSLEGLAAAGDEQGATVAWIEHRSGDDRVRAASFRVRDGAVTVDPPETLASGAADLVDVDVARADGAAAVVWERREANEVYLHADGETRRVSPPEASRVLEPTVALVDGTPVVAWGDYQDGTYTGSLVVMGESRTERRFGSAVGGDSPSLSPVGDDVAVGWVDPDEGVAYAGLARADEGYAVGDVRELGPARAVSSFAGGGTPGVVDIAGEGRYYLRSDMGTVSVGRLGPEGPTDERTLGSGQGPRLAADGDNWLATWVVQRRGSGSDVAYATPEGESLAVKLPSNSLRAAPVYAPEPAIAWSESGQRQRVLVSAHRADAEGGPLVRLRAAPLRFLFVGVAGIAAGAVTAPLFPWVVVPFLLGFLLTTRLARDALARAAVGLSRATSRGSDRHDVGDRLARIHPVVPVGLYVALNVALLRYWTGGTTLLPGVYVASPLGLTAGALVATAAVALTWRLRSPWKLSAAFAVCQSAALWATALPSFL